MVSPPYQMDSGISIQLIDDQLIIEKPSTIVLSYSQSHQITVTVGDSVADYVCGACGTLTVKSELQTIQNYLNGYRSSIFNFW